MINNYVNLQDIAFYCLQNEQLMAYEQMISIYAHGHDIHKENLQNSYRVFSHALQRVLDHFHGEDVLDFTSGFCPKGTYLEFGYDTFTALNHKIPEAMKVVNAALCITFEQFTVRLHGQMVQTLPDDILKKYPF